MKKTKSAIVAAILITCSGCGFSDINPFKKSVSACSIVRDGTDTFTATAKPEEVLGMFEIDNDHIYDGFQLRNNIISDADNADIVLIQVKPELYLFGVQTSRVRQLKDFKNRVTEEMQRHQEFKGDKKQSRVIQTVQKECIALGNIEHCKDRTLIVISDCFQNTDDISLYSNAFMDSVNNDPEEIAKRYQELFPLPKISNMRVYIVHKPKDAQEQKRFDISSQALSIWLTKYAGAKTTVEPNIIPQ